LAEWEPAAEEVIPPVTEETPSFQNIHIKDIKCNGADRAIWLQGLPEMPIKKINLDNIVISAKTGVVCVEAKLTGLLKGLVRLIELVWSRRCFLEARQIIRGLLWLCLSRFGFLVFTRVGSSKIRLIKIFKSTSLDDFFFTLLKKAKNILHYLRITSSPKCVSKKPLGAASGVIKKIEQ
jgi:hypothetical protein